METLQPFAAILLVLSCLGGALALLRRRGLLAFRSPRVLSRNRELEVLERISLGPQHAVHLVRAGERTLLVATSPSSCQLLYGGPAPEQPL